MREMAIHHQSVKTCKLFFKTASNEFKRFDITSLVVYDGPGNELLVHLCRPSCDTDQDCTTAIRTNHVTANHQRGALTERETEVLALLSQGKDTKDVATDMCISVATVRNHTQHILHKLNVHNRFEAINLGHKLGLI